MATDNKLNSRAKREGIIENDKSKNTFRYGAGIKQKIFSFFRHVKPIVGLAIGEKALYLTTYDNERKLTAKKISLESSTFEDIGKKLGQLKKELNRSSSLIISLLPGEAFMEIFEFPLSAIDEQIEEAMKLAVSTLPILESEIYIDWMPINDKNLKKKEIVLSFARKNIIDRYLKIFEANGLAIIAVETFAWSLGRFLKVDGGINMVILDQSDKIIFVIYDGQIPYFQFSLPKEINEKNDNLLKSAAHFANRFIHFVFVENGQKMESIIVANNDEIKDYLKKNISGIAIENKFPDLELKEMEILASEGASQRGLIPRRDDTIISLMPIGTELAHERQRLNSFVDFVQKFLIGFGGFLIVLFLGVVVMINSLTAKIEKSLQKEAALPVEVVSLKEKAQWFNKQVLKISKIYSTMPLWEKVFAEIDKFAGIGIVINQISANENNEIVFSGVVASRETLILLKNNLADSSVFEAEPFPLALFLNKENIAFTVKAKLKDIKLLYQHE